MAELQEMPSAADVAAEDGERKVTSLELFFDLVFVFAITQVTAKMAAEPVWGGLVRGLLIVSLLWWAWVAYAWLTNTVDADEGGTRILVFAAMGAMFVVALTIPNAFGSDALLFALAYGAVRLLHIFLYERGAHDEGVEAAVKRLAPGVLLAMGLLIAASQFDGAVQGALWVAAVAVDYVGVVLAGTEGWKVSAGHFAERHGLIIIIALGESIVAIGVGVSGLPLDAGLIGASLLGLAVTCCLWWAYFDVVALVAERKLRQATGRDRAALARDSYSLLHLPMIDREWGRSPGLVPLPALWGFLHHATLLGFLIAVSLCDLSDMEIPLPITVTGTVTGLALSTGLPWPFPEPAPAPPAPRIRPSARPRACRRVIGRPLSSAQAAG
ncbi:MAG: low temperature requirement protein A [Candidatus Promineofilum sp.]|nr:low temperature requirement protein A [Promineifilum sp.]